VPFGSHEAPSAKPAFQGIEVDDALAIAEQIDV
jgi:hypothetical protein